MATLAESIEGLMTPQLLGTLAARTGVPETRIRTGMTAATTVLLDDLAAQARDPHAMIEVVDLIDHSPDVTDPTSLLEEDAPTRERGNQLLGLATDNVQGLVERLGSLIGTGAGAAAGVLGMASRVLLGAFRSVRRARGGLDPSSLASSLLEEQSMIHAAVPVGLLTAAPARRAPWWPLILTMVSLAILIGIFLVAQRRPARDVVPGPGAQSRPVAGAVLTLPPESAEGRLLAHVRESDDASPWFALTNVEFDSGSPALPATADAELDNLARVLEDNPRARIAVVGYADNLGSADEARALAQGRADAIRQALVARGIDGSRIEASAGGESNQDVAIRALPAG